MGCVVYNGWVTGEATSMWWALSLIGSPWFIIIFFKKKKGNIGCYFYLGEMANVLVRQHAEREGDGRVLDRQLLQEGILARSQL